CLAPGRLVRSCRGGPVSSSGRQRLALPLSRAARDSSNAAGRPAGGRRAHGRAAVRRIGRRLVLIQRRLFDRVGAVAGKRFGANFVERGIAESAARLSPLVGIAVGARALLPAAHWAYADARASESAAPDVALRHD